MFIRRTAPSMVVAEDALPGRGEPILVHPAPHLKLGTDILAPVGEGQAEIFLAAGCYWGVEEIMWDLPGVVTTAVGFMGGFTPNPTYGEVCTGMTGHTETVRVVYSGTDPLPLILKTFWECHDPTSLNAQGNDIGTQYRSAIFTTTPEQSRLATESRDAYDDVLRAAGQGPIVTQIVDASQTTGFFPAEEDHQQYLIKVPHGYRCHAKTGMACPMPGAGPLADLS